MNRIIKFRGKCPGGWVYGLPFKSNSQHHTPDLHFIVTDLYNPNGGYGGNTFVNVNPKTVGQYTGLEDRNGKDIYEGDILKDTDENIVLVVWVNEWGMFGSLFNSEYIDYKNGKTLDESMFWTFPIECNAVEAIGNIHDNPELLND